MSFDDGPDELSEFALMSEARRLAVMAKMLLDHPRMKANKDNSGLYETALDHVSLVLHLMQCSEKCSDAEEFDALLYLICCNAEGLAWTLSRLRIE